jgi:uncharacterized membrane protein
MGVSILGHGWKQNTVIGIFVIIALVFTIIACDDDNGVPIGDKKYTVYIVGSYYGSNNGPQACYWKNEVRTDFPVEADYSWASAITISEGSIYIAGNYYVDYAVNKPLYWKDGVKTELPVNNKAAYYADAISVSEGSVYVLGRDNTYSAEFYWKDGEIINIPRDGYIQATFDGGIAL